MKVSRAVMSSIRWAFNTSQWNPTVTDWISAGRCIQPEEKERIGKFVFKKDAKSSMVSDASKDRCNLWYNVIDVEPLQQVSQV